MTAPMIPLYCRGLGRCGHNLTGRDVPQAMVRPDAAAAAMWAPLLKAAVSDAGAAEAVNFLCICPRSCYQLGKFPS